MAWLTYYFALPQSNVKQLLGWGMMGDFLISFAHFKHSDKVKASTVEMVHTIRKAGHKVMLDSGAFTNVAKPGHVRLEEYCEFLKSEGQHFHEYITLDDCKSREGTLKNYTAMVRMGFKRQLFVDHLKMPHDDRVNPIWRAVPKLCLSAWGTDPSTHNPARNQQVRDEKEREAAKEAARKDDRTVPLNEIAARMSERAEKARKDKTKLHLLAVGSLSKFFPHLDTIESVDSASVFRCVGYGQVLQCVDKDIGGLKIPVLTRHTHPEATNTDRQGFTPELKAKLVAFLRGRSFSTKNNAYRAFCFHELSRYIKRLNEMSPKTIMDAFARHKQAAAKSENGPSYFWFDDGVADGWPMNPEHAQKVEDLPDYDPEQAVLCKLDLSGDEAYVESEDGLVRITCEVMEKAVWSSAYVNSLPDSSFLYIEPGGKKDEEGKTTPRSLRHFPVKDREGNVDLPHLRNALARIPQSNVPQSAKDEARRRAQRMLEAENKDEKEKSEDRDVRLLPVEKADEDRQIVFGVVLEPDSVDAQGDTIDADEIERAAHLWLARFQDRGLQHEKIVNSKVEIYESYLAPTNLTMGGQKVKKGTWLLMLHVLDKDLWAEIKSGKFTGFSMGGFARRVRT